MNKIFYAFEQKLYEMEKTHQFRYIRDNHLILGNTLVMGIPGESHCTEGDQYQSVIQEKKTEKLIAKATPDLGKVSSIIIYNHTQGDYDKDTGRFHTASPALKKFMKSLPMHLTMRLFVQSHNHWSHTQFLILGWLTQLILGVAWWLFPPLSIGLRPGEPKPARRGQAQRGSEPLFWATFVCLNAGILLRALFEPLYALTQVSVYGLLTGISGLFLFVAAAAFVVNMWGRVRQLGRSKE